MIKFLASSPTGDIVGLGLSKQNLIKLLDKKPIHVKLSELGLSNINILIFGGETEDEMKNELKEIFPNETISKYNRTVKGS